jgi:hypothetical protein
LINNIINRIAEHELVNRSIPLWVHVQCLALEGQTLPSGADGISKIIDAFCQTGALLLYKGGTHPTDNYGNFDLGKISSDDFDIKPIDELNSLIIDIIKKWATYYNVIEQASLSDFLSNCLQVISLYRKDFRSVAVFRHGAQDQHVKRHKSYSLFEIFQTLILMDSASEGNTFVHITFSYS